MADRPPSRAGGSILALLTILGAIVGTAKGQPTAGLLIGLAAGVVIAVAIWLVDRRRAG